MLFTFLLVVQALVAAALVGVILMQRSEGGGLGMGGSPSGLISARGAADFLTRATTILAALFVLLSIGLAGLAAVQRAPSEIDTSLARQGPAAAPALPGTAVPLEGDPLSAAAGAAGNETVPAPAAVPPPAEQKAAAHPKASTEPARERTSTPKAAEKTPASEPVLIVPPRPAPSAPAPAGNSSSVPLGQ